jgi:phage terminase large subunit-like protein
MDDGDRAIRFIELLTHVKGPLAGTRLILNEWQRAAIKTIFGKKTPDGRRQISTTFWFIPRKAGKTTTMGAVSLFCLFCGREPGSELYSCAADKEQAGLIYENAKAMILADADLSKLVTRRKIKIIDSKKRIEFRPTNSFYRVLSSDAYTKHGLNPNVVFYDELAQWPDRELFDVMTSAQGARTQPLNFITTTAGIYHPQQIGYIQYDYACRVRDGRAIDPSHLPVIYEADSKDDPFDPAVWAKVNPNLGKANFAGFLDKEANKAREMPSELAKFRMLYLNIWQSTVNSWIPHSKWKACDDVVDDAELVGQPCYGGLDLAAVTDLAALVLLFPRPGNKVAIRVFAYIGRESAAKREKEDKIPYTLWEQQGHVTFTAGEITDYDAIRAHLGTLKDRYDIKELAYDRFGATQLATQLQGDGFTMVQFGQGFASMSAPAKEFERLIISRRVIHNGNPVATEHVCNAVAVRDAADNLKVDKSKANRRIDVVVALLMALGRYMVAPVDAVNGKLDDFVDFG